jgi:hypothetical protein
VTAKLATDHEDRPNSIAAICSRLETFEAVAMKIISGGQTGVDRAALDTAIAKGISYGGWCPRGGWAEDLPRAPGLLALYPHLQETLLQDPAQRTEWNVRDADRLMILTGGTGITVSRGTETARGFAIELGKPCIVLNLDTNAALASARAFLGEGGSNVSICIAGPRESEAPGIYVKACEFLHRCFNRPDLVTPK